MTNMSCGATNTNEFYENRFRKFNNINNNNKNNRQEKNR